MPTDLYVSTYTPRLGTGRAQRTYTCVRALALLGPVELAYVPFDGDEPSPEYTAIEGLTLRAIHPSRRLRRLASYARQCGRGTPPHIARGVSRELIDQSAHLAGQPGRGRVIADDLVAAAAMFGLARRRPVIYNAHNLGSSYYSPAKGLTPPWREPLFRAFERRLISHAAESWMVSRRDVRSAQELAHGAHVRYVPNAVDVQSISPVPSTDRPRSRILMVGDFSYLPNRTARAFLVEEVMPLLWRELPQVRLTLVGRGSGNWRSPDPRVEVAGFVDDLASAYQQADCVIVPLRTGAGSPLKFVEALAYRVPVVATSFAARGLEVIAGKHYLQGDDAPSLAARILEVMRDGGEPIASEGRRLAQAEYSIEAIAQRIAAGLPESRS